MPLLPLLLLTYCCYWLLLLLVLLLPLLLLIVILLLLLSADAAACGIMPLLQVLLLLLPLQLALLQLLLQNCLGLPRRREILPVDLAAQAQLLEDSIVAHGGPPDDFPIFQFQTARGPVTS